MSVKRWMHRAALVALIALSMQAQQQPPPAAPKPEEAKQTEETKPADPFNLPAPVDPKTYRIGPEDVLRIVVFREPELSAHVGVRPDGMVTINLVGELQVNGLTPLELAERLKKEYAKLVVTPVVSVEVVAVRSKKYYVTGQVGRPGMFPLVVPLTVMEALTLSGGPTEFANKKKITILRNNKPFYFNWNDALKGKNPQQNIYVENGDFIVVK